MSFASIVQTIDNFLWGWPLILLLFGTHVFMTVKTGFVQKDLFKAIKLSVSKDPDANGDVSQFGALATALSSTIGTGNIVGVGTAIILGGPGAVLWMWLSGIFGMATKYAETLIAVKFRVKSEDGTMLGGAMYALDRGLKLKWLGILFALFASACGFGIGCTVPSNAVVSIVQEHITVDSSIDRFIPLILGIIMSALVGFVIIGGVKSITKVSEMLVPFMAAFYILGCIAILIMNADVMWETVKIILFDATNPASVGGGIAGTTLAATCRYGLARGLFSNESGMGSAPLIASAAQTRNAKRQALVSMTGTFWDTVVVCLMTGLVLVSCIIKHPSIDMTADGSKLSSMAFATIPVVGTPILVLGLIAFTFTTMLGWYYYGERCAVYLFGEKVIIIYKILWVIAIFLGSIAVLDVIWNLADILNGLMALPNVAAVLLLSGLIAAETKKYKGKHLDDVDPEEPPVVKNSKKGVLG